MYTFKLTHLALFALATLGGCGDDDDEDAPFPRNQTHAVTTAPSDAGASPDASR